MINLGSHNETTIIELAHAVKRVTKSSSRIVFEPYRKYYGNNFRDIRKRVSGLKKLKKIFGVVPKTSLKEILRKMNAYFTAHPEELENI